MSKVGDSDLHYVGTVTGYAETDDTYEIFLKPILTVHRGMHEEIVRLPSYAVNVLVNPTVTNWKESWNYEPFQGFRPLDEMDEHHAVCDAEDANQKRARHVYDEGKEREKHGAHIGHEAYEGREDHLSAVKESTHV